MKNSTYNNNSCGHFVFSVVNPKQQEKKERERERKRGVNLMQQI